ncbi:MAG: hypothetical protein KIS66_14860 [Fimbriimonadaceae bacterium]|nr:hypothetical protein [Fimbriimonadaceae bacterium]
MERLNSEGFPRDRLLWVLTQPRFVREARRIDACLLCRAHRVNDAGLCDACHATLSDAEMRLVERWMNGTGP